MIIISETRFIFGGRSYSAHHQIPPIVIDSLSSTPPIMIDGVRPSPQPPSRPRARHQSGFPFPEFFFSFHFRFVLSSYPPFLPPTVPPTYCTSRLLYLPLTVTPAYCYSRILLLLLSRHLIAAYTYGTSYDMLVYLLIHYSSYFVPNAGDDDDDDRNHDECSSENEIYFRKLTC